MSILFGLETEYGITRDNVAGVDVVEESIRVVRAAREKGVRMKWDYTLEDPHRDARGFTVEALRQDLDESEYFSLDAARALSFSEIKSDLTLKNGARFYNDHAHPEYCTPECRTLPELLRQDWSGDRLAESCAHEVSQGSEHPVVLYKNNTDFQGHSYGCHENYLLPRSIPWSELAQAMTAFLVTRQVFCGAGKFGVEEEDRFVGPGFQISQRADFFHVLQSVDTMQRRPIVNTRDEPHADERNWRRLHVIIGDANLSPHATWLKIGTTALVLQSISKGIAPSHFPRLKDPLGALRSISRDPTFAWEVELESGIRVSALHVQQRYADLVREYAEDVFAGEDPSWLRCFKDWERILIDLEADPLMTADRLDWSAKFALIESFRKEEGLEADDPWLRSLDLEYHRLDSTKGLFYKMLEQGSFQIPLTLKEVQQDALVAPGDTRAAVRGACIERFGKEVSASQWDHVRFDGPDGGLELDLRRLFDPKVVQMAVERIRSAQSPEELADLPFAIPCGRRAAAKG